MDRTFEPGYAFIFDLDGVLVDTSQLHYLSWRDLARDFDYELSESFNEKLKGVSRKECLELILSDAGVQAGEVEKEALAEKKNRLYLDRIAHMSEADLLPGVMEFLIGAARVKIPMAIGSASKNSEFILRSTGIRNFFKVIVDGNVVTRSKPDPEVFLTAGKMLGYPPKQCVVFEDSVKGIEAGCKAGMKVVALCGTVEYEQADLQFDSFERFKAYEIVNWFSII